MGFVLKALLPWCAAAVACAAWPAGAGAVDLAQAWTQALQRDARLAAAAAQRDAQAEKREQGRAGLRPRVQLNAGHLHHSASLRGFGDGSVDGPSVRSTNLAVTVAQPLYNRAARVARDAGALQAELGLAQWQQARGELALRLVQAWFDALQAQQQHELARLLLQAAQAHRADAPPLPGGAGADEAAHHEAERRALDIRLRRLRADEAAARVQAQARRVPLQGLVGPLPDRLPWAPPEPMPGAARLQQARAWVDQAAEGGAAVWVQRVQSALADNALQQAHAAHAPVVELTASYTSDRGFQMLPSGSIVGRAAGIQLTVPLFEGGAASSRVREAEHLRAKARHEQLATQATAMQDAQTAWLDLEAALARAEGCGGNGDEDQATLDGRLEALFNARDCDRNAIDAWAALHRLQALTGRFDGSPAGAAPQP